MLYPADSTQQDQSALQLLYKGECAKTPELRKQFSEAMPFRSEGWRESLSTRQVQLQDGGCSESCRAALDQTNEVREHATQRAVTVSPIRSVPPVHQEQAPMHASRDSGARNTNQPSPSGDEELQNKLTAAEQQVRQLKIQVSQEKEEANLMREKLAALQTKLDVPMREQRQATPKEAAKTLRAEEEALKAREDAVVAYAKAERELREEADKTRKEEAASAASDGEEEADKTRNEAVTSAETVKKAAEEDARKLREEAKNEVGDRMQILTLKAQLEYIRQQLSKHLVWARTKIAKQAPLQAAAEKSVRQMREVRNQVEIACIQYWKDTSTAAESRK